VLKLELVVPGSTLLADVQRLWRDNRDYLGFFPDGAFQERAAKGQIIAALADTELARYILYADGGS
jgi:hypothetical protein